MNITYEPFEFIFDESELFDALRLVSSAEEARQQTRAFIEAFEPGMDWAVSHDLLLLLSLVSVPARIKVDRIRKAEQEARLATMIRQEAEARRMSLSEEEFTRQFREAAAAEDRQWQERRAQLRRSLIQQGKPLPDEP